MGQTVWAIRYRPRQKFRFNNFMHFRGSAVPHDAAACAEADAGKIPSGSGPRTSMGCGHQDHVRRTPARMLKVSWEIRMVQLGDRLLKNPLSLSAASRKLSSEAHKWSSLSGRSARRDQRTAGRAHSQNVAKGRMA